MVRLREAQFDDFPKIDALKRRHGLFSPSFSDWKRLWTDNPLVLEYGSIWPIGWVLEEESGQIVGYLGNIPMTYELGPRKVIAMAANAWVVDEDYRSSAILLLAKFFSQKSPELFLATTVSYTAGMAFKGFGAQKVPSPDYDQVLFAVSNYRGLGRAILRKKSLPFHNVLGNLVDFWLRIYELFTRLPKKINLNNDITITTADLFDDRFDEFWQRLKQQRHKLMFVRDKKNLNWHFKYIFSNNQGWLSICEKDSQIMGYAIFARSDDYNLGLRRARLADLQALGDQADSIMSSLLIHGIETCKNHKVHLLESVGFEATKRSLIKKYLRLQRKYPTWPYFYKVREVSLHKILEKEDYWDPSTIDGDASL